MSLLEPDASFEKMWAGTTQARVHVLLVVSVAIAQALHQLPAIQKTTRHTPRLFWQLSVGHGNATARC